ncbi:hypothetical protein ACFSC6_04005 [Rufibacter sediminis]|uniref:Peptidase M48 domain-containing protein n=1 Tax=Rufibacter sediminis TaxID=2762756 RepID=A0ABR6VY91_9BACT|nr:hypothetical protein [Rufibacter sediminis]MBC3542131.1 hypothetical protein [Rufibacter sediminis]
MDRFQKYRHYSSDDLVEDSSFWSWVLREERGEDGFWSEFIASHPNQATAVEMAREKVLQLNNAEFKLPDDKVASLWNKITQASRVALPSEMEQEKTGTGAG